MVYVVNCRDCGFLRIRDTTYDLGNASLVADQHGMAMFNGEISHTVVWKTFFPSKGRKHLTENHDLPMARDNILTTSEALERIADAEDDYDTCPECDETFIDVDMTGAGDLYFIHEDNGTTIDGCTHKNDEIDHVQL